MSPCLLTDFLVQFTWAAVYADRQPAPSLSQPTASIAQTEEDACSLCTFACLFTLYIYYIFADRFPTKARKKQRAEI